MEVVFFVPSFSAVVVLLGSIIAPLAWLIAHDHHDPHHRPDPAHPRRHWSDPSVTASLQALLGSSFTVFGAPPASDLLLASTVAELWFRNGLSFSARFDGEFAEHSQKYAGIGRLCNIW